MPIGKVVVTDHVFPSLELGREIVESAGLTLVYDGDVVEPDDVVELARAADAIVVCYTHLPRAVVERLDRCKVISRTGVGVDNVDLDAATSRGIVVTFVPDYCQDEVSDHALALMLALSRRLPKLGAGTRDGRWETAAAKPSFRLRGQTLGLVGFGRISREVARKAQVFGVRVIAHDPYVDAATFVAGGVEACAFGELLRQADFVSLHLPLTDETKHILGADELEAMKSSAHVINTSRGPLIDTAALRSAIEAGAIAGAGLDVLEVEPPAPDDPLLAAENVLITPHTAFYSEDSVAELQRKAFEQAVAVLRGEEPAYAANDV